MYGYVYCVTNNNDASNMFAFSCLYTHLLVKQPIDPNTDPKLQPDMMHMLCCMLSKLCFWRLSQQPYPRCFLEQCCERRCKKRKWICVEPWLEEIDGRNPAAIQNYGQDLLSCFRL